MMMPCIITKDEEDMMIGPSSSSSSIHLSEKMDSVSCSCSSSIQLRFDNFEDLTSRLVLLPYIEEEGTGAVVATLIPKSDDDEHFTEIDGCVLSSVRSAQQKQQHVELSPEQEGEEDGSSSSQGIDDDNTHNIREMDFASILALIREQPSPLILTFDQPLSCNSGETSQISVKSLQTPVKQSQTMAKTVTPYSGGYDAQSVYDENDDETNDSDTDSTDSHATPGTTPDVVTDDEEEDDDDVRITIPVVTKPNETNVNVKPNNNNNNSQVGAWSAWMRATSEKLAADAAIGAASLSSRVATAASEAQERARSSRMAATNNNANTTVAGDINSAKTDYDAESSHCQLFLQSTSGAFLPLKPASSKSSELNVTTASVLLVRKTAVQPCPTKGYAFQWYRSSTLSPDQEWLPLLGATHSAFQPSATEVGYRLRCVVTVKDSPHSDDSSTSSDDHSDTSSLEGSQHNCSNHASYICQTPTEISADLALFNGARQALARGAKFGNILGRGVAQGRNFRLTVQMGMCQKKVSSALTIHQVVGQVAEPLTDKPLMRISAVCDHSKPRGFALNFRLEDSENTLLSALTDDDGLFQLEAPNRLTRESLLFAIGIANFKGKPADLSATTILYDENDSNSIISARSSQSSISSASSSLSGSCYSTSFASSSSISVCSSQFSCSESSKKRSNSIHSHPSDCSVSSHRTNDLENIDSALESVDLVNQPKPTDDVLKAKENNKRAELEMEIRRLRAKLTRKDKVINELQRDITVTESNRLKSEKQFDVCNSELQKTRADFTQFQQNFRDLENTNQLHESKVDKLQMDHSTQVAALKDQLQSESKTVAELEKRIDAYQNEKSVLSGSINAMENKLCKMKELQASHDALSMRVAQHDTINLQLKEVNERYKEICINYENAKRLENQTKEQLLESKDKVNELQNEIQALEEKNKSCESELDSFQQKMSKLKSERNSYKTKFESLSKEIARICRKGQTLKEVEQILVDDLARQEEVGLLKKQKRKALEDLHHYRTSYEQQVVITEQLIESAARSSGKAAGSKSGGIGGAASLIRPAANLLPFKGKNKNHRHSVSSNAIVDYNTVSLLKRNAELERLLSELTEYVNAKEMQLSTMKQVNGTLQEEIHALAQANMNNNDV